MSKQTEKALVPKRRFPEFQNSGEWKVKPMAKLFTIGNGKDHKHLPEGDIPVYGSGGYMRSVNEYLYEGESPCIGRKGTIDKPVFLSGKFWTVDTLFYTYSFQNCLPKFIYLIFQNINWRSHNEAGGVPSLSKANINKIEVACPKLAEQQKISEFLSSIDEVITAHTQKHEALKAHKKALMQQLFPAEGETVPKRRFPEFLNAGEWKVDALDELVNIVDGDRGTNYPKADEFSNNGYCVFLNAKNVTKNGFKFDIIQFITQEKDNILRKGKLERLDVILTTRGSVGHFSFYSDDVPYDNMRINSGMVILRVNSDTLTPDYLYAFSESQIVSRTIGDVAFGNAQQQLTVLEIKKFKIYYPKPSEQKKIVDCLSSLDDLITAQDQKIVSLKAHKKGLMQQLFPATDEVNG